MACFWLNGKYTFLVGEQIIFQAAETPNQVGRGENSNSGLVRINQENSTTLLPTVVFYDGRMHPRFLAPTARLYRCRLCSPYSEWKGVMVPCACGRLRAPASWFELFSSYRYCITRVVYDGTKEASSVYILGLFGILMTIRLFYIILAIAMKFTFLRSVYTKWISYEEFTGNKLNVCVSWPLNG